MKGKKNLQRVRFLYFSERECDFSLGFWAIRSSEFVGTRRKVVLRSESFAWVLVLRSFDQIREVRVLSYLSYTLFKCFVDDCFDLRP